jgi:hypothetical protein
VLRHSQLQGRDHRTPSVELLSISPNNSIASLRCV